MSKKCKVNTGDRYKAFTVLEEVEPFVRKNGIKNRRFRCKCDCGNEKIVLLRELRHGETQSCGCIRTENNYIHHMRYSSVYESWKSMLRRCYNPNHEEYPNYGGRGIKVCESWKNSIINFYLDMGDKPDGATLDRINVDQDYNKDNCKWSDIKEQNRNKRNTIKISYKNNIKSLCDWYDIFKLKDKGISYRKMYYRIKTLSWSLDEFLKFYDVEGYTRL